MHIRSTLSTLDEGQLESEYCYESEDEEEGDEHDDEDFIASGLMALTQSAEKHLRAVPAFAPCIRNFHDDIDLRTVCLAQVTKKRPRRKRQLQFGREQGLRDNTELNDGFGSAMMEHKEG